MRFGATPRATAEALEGLRALPSGRGERFAGYGVMGLPFQAGDFLAFRRFAASSIGPPYSAVWHRTRDRRWTCYVDIEPARSCPRYFSAQLERVVVTEIRLTWTGAADLAISLPVARVDLGLRLGASPATRLLNTALPLVPERAWDSPRVLRALSGLAGPLLGAGTIRLTGRAPNAHLFGVAPRQIWRVIAGAAVVRGRELGLMGALSQQPRLGDLLQPNAGVFAFGSTWFEGS